MLDLPILNVRLHACSEDWQQMTPTAQGRHCQSCDREVVDLTAATHADLLLARATSPDGRVCGRLRTGQLAAPVRLRPRLKRFVVALVLVCGLGLSAQEAAAQVRRATTARKSVVRKPPPPVETVTETSGDLMSSSPEPVSAARGPVVYTYVEQMPEFKEGGHQGAIKFVQQHLRWPPNTGMLDAEGRVFVSFVVGADGKLREFKILKGLHELPDTEALRVVQLLDGHYEPGQQNGQPVAVSLAIPVTFQR